MAIIDCPKCGSKISDRAPECVHCIKITAQGKITNRKEARKQKVKNGFGFFREVLSALAPRPVLKSPCPVCCVKIIVKINPDIKTKRYPYDDNCSHVEIIKCETCKTQLAIVMYSNGEAGLKDIKWDEAEDVYITKISKIESQADALSDVISNIKDEIYELEENETDENLSEKQREQASSKIEDMNIKLEKLQIQSENLEIKQEKIEDSFTTREEKYEDKKNKWQTKAGHKGLI